MNFEFVGALKDIEKNKGIKRETILAAIEKALRSAYKRNFGSAQNVEVDVDPETGSIEVVARKTVVEEVEDDTLEISVPNARKISPEAEVGDVVQVEVTPERFGRIAAQTAKQVIMQQIREAERDMIYEEYVEKEGDIITGKVRRVQGGNVFIDLGRIEALLLPHEQIPDERYEPDQRLKVYIVEVKQTTRAPQIIVSRSHPEFLKRLFELEVPEIHDGAVEIKGIAREAGDRSKVAVYSEEENVDAVGACVGTRGSRVQAVVDELSGEKIDIVSWDPKSERFVANALSPAEVTRVRTYEENDTKIAEVVVPDYQLSLAIGKEGQNARLAAKLTGWKIDIKSESEAEEFFEPDDEDKKLADILQREIPSDRQEEEVDSETAAEAEAEEKEGPAEESNGEESSDSDNDALQ